MSEAELQKKMRVKLNAAGALCWRNHGGPHSIRGIPDIVGVHRGVFFAVEVKLPGKERNLTDLQAKKLRDIKEHGGVTAVATTVNEALEVMDECNKKAKSRKKDS